MITQNIVGLRNTSHGIQNYSKKSNMILQMRGNSKENDERKGDQVIKNRQDVIQSDDEPCEEIYYNIPHYLDNQINWLATRNYKK